VDSQDRQPAPLPAGLMSAQRVEAFSDGVFAIAATLLVLDLAVPPREETSAGGLAAALGRQWPAYFAYLVSFLVIGIIVVNHHTMFAKVRQVDRPVMFANLALLLVVSALPFPTRLLAEYLTAGADSHVAAAVYSGAMFAMSLAYSTLWLAITRDARLLHEHLDPAASRASGSGYGGGEDSSGYDGNGYAEGGSYESGSGGGYGGGEDTGAHGGYGSGSSYEGGDSGGYENTAGFADAGYGSAGYDSAGYAAADIPSEPGNEFAKSVEILIDTAVDGAKKVGHEIAEGVEAAWDWATGDSGNQGGGGGEGGAPSGNDGGAEGAGPT
jgi:TMEM175 potassium channel family protein